MEVVVFYRDEECPGVMLEQRKGKLIVRNGKQGKPYEVKCAVGEEFDTAYSFFYGFKYASKTIR